MKRLIHLFICIILTNLFQVEVKSQDLLEYFREAENYYKEDEYLKATDVIFNVEPRFKEYIKIEDTAFPYLYLLSELGKFAVRAHLHPEAELLTSEVMNIINKYHSDDNPYYKKNLILRAVHFHDQGRYEEADTLLKEVLSKCDTSLKEDYLEYALCLYRMASLYLDMNRKSEAKLLINESRSMIHIAGFEELSTDDSLNIELLFHEVHEHYGELESLLKKDLISLKKDFDENPSDYCIGLNNLAMFYHDMERYEEAEPLMEKARSIFDTLKQKDLYLRRIIMNNLAMLYYDMEYYLEAEPLMKDQFEDIKDRLITETVFLSEGETEKYLDNMINSYTELYQSYNLSYFHINPSLCAFAMDIELTVKGFLLDRWRGIVEQSRGSRDSNLTEMIDTLNAMQNLLANLKGAFKEQSVVKIRDLNAQIHEKEKVLSLKPPSPIFSDTYGGITWKDVQQELQSDEALVEFVRFQFYRKRWTDSVYYCALVLRPDDEWPHLFYLGEERTLDIVNIVNGVKDIKSVCRLYGCNLNQNSAFSNSVDNYSDKLWNFIWAPFDSLLDGFEKVYYVPTGLLNRVAFNALKDNLGRLLIDRFNLCCITSSNQLWDKRWEQWSPEEYNTAALFGDVNYNWNSKKPDKDKMDPGYEPLPETRQEIKYADSLMKINGLSTCSFYADSATEANVKAQSGPLAPDILFLSTHGFYKKRLKDKAAFRRLPGIVNYYFEEDPMLRSGLAFAGVNKFLRGEPIIDREENGVLLAREVASMDLSKTKLVVLSACQTGLGDIHGSEGVYGLQRAFKMARAKYILTSLWKVEVNSSKLLMQYFFENLLWEKLSVRDALYKAQNMLREQTMYTDPYYWAAWVLIE